MFDNERQILQGAILCARLRYEARQVGVARSEAPSNRGYWKVVQVCVRVLGDVWSGSIVVVVVGGGRFTLSLVVVGFAWHHGQA